MADGTAIVTTKSGKKETVKDPNDQLDYPFDWSDWLLANADVYDSHQIITQDPDDATTPISVVNSAFYQGKVIVFVSGGTPGKKHSITCRITTTGNGGPVRIKDQTLYIKIKEN